MEHRECIQLAILGPPFLAPLGILPTSPRAWSRRDAGHLWGADRPWHKITAAVWANAMQYIVGTGGAEGAFIAAYTGVARIRR